MGPVFFPQRIEIAGQRPKKALTALHMKKGL